jgi:radical SAM protein with 4Fe4S-binding SPASM domain
LEIYDFLSIYVIDENIYITNWTPRELVKLSLQGKLLGRAGRQGQGPGEFLWMETVYEFEGNIALLDSRRFVLMLYTKTLKFIREMRLKKHKMGFMVDKENNFIFFGSRQRDFYFEKYSKDMVPIEYFGPSVSSRSSWKNRKLFDDVRCALYVPEENGIWAAFKDRYDIRYYKNQKLAVEIKAEIFRFFFTRHFNPCLGNNAAVDTGGEIKCCLWSDEILGNIETDGLKDMIIRGKFDFYWEFSKSKIESCKDCELRHACDDCRIYALKQSGRMDATPAYCDYDPYKG